MVFICLEWHRLNLHKTEPHRELQTSYVGMNEILKAIKKKNTRQSGLGNERLRQ